MVNLHLVLYVVALICLLCAAFQSRVPQPVQWQWLAGAAIVLTWII